MAKADKDKSGVKKARKMWRVTAVLVVFVAIFLGFSIAFNLAGIGVKTNNFLAAFPITRSFFRPVGDIKTPQQLEKEEHEKAVKLLQEERSNLDQLANNLASWELQLKAKEEELMEKELAIEELQQRLDTRLQNVQDLVSYYEKMDAEQAVNIMDNISDNQLLIVVLKNMKEQKCAEILAAMDPRKAARLIETMSAQ